MVTTSTSREDPQQGVALALDPEVHRVERHQPRALRHLAAGPRAAAPGSMLARNRYGTRRMESRPASGGKSAKHVELGVERPGLVEIVARTPVQRKVRLPVATWSPRRPRPGSRSSLQVLLGKSSPTVATSTHLGEEAGRVREVRGRAARGPPRPCRTASRRCRGPPSPRTSEVSHGASWSFSAPAGKYLPSRRSRRLPGGQREGRRIGDDRVRAGAPRSPQSRGRRRPRITRRRTSWPSPRCAGGCAITASTVTGVVALVPDVVVGHEGQRRVAQLGLARQLRLRHVRHADDVHAPAGGRCATRALRRELRAPRCRCRCRPAAPWRPRRAAGLSRRIRASVGADRIGHADVGDDPVAEEAGRPPPGVRRRTGRG